MGAGGESERESSAVGLQNLSYIIGVDLNETKYDTISMRN